MGNAPSVTPAVGRRRAVVAAGVGTFIELYDVWLFGYFAVFLAARFFPQHDPTAALLATFAVFAVGFFIRPLGGILFGHIGDRIGRRHALALSLLLSTVATTAFGLLPTYDMVGLFAPVLLLVCRLLQGLAASAEIPGAQLLLLEHARTGRQGRTVALNNAAGNLGTAAAASIALLLAKLLPADQLTNWGWRVPFLAAAPVGLIGLYVRTRVLETPPFAALRHHGAPAALPLAVSLRTAKRGMAVITIWMAAVLLGGYLLGGFLPSYLIRVAHLPPGDAFAATLCTVLIGALSMIGGGYLVDRYPLRRVAVAVMACLAAAAVPGLLIVTRFETLGAAILGQALWGVFIGAAYTIGSVLSTALFPTAIRYTSTALALNTGAAVFASTAPYVSTWLVAVTRSPLAPGFYLLAAAGAGLIAAFFGLAGLPDGRTPVAVPPCGAAITA